MSILTFTRTVLVRCNVPCGMVMWHAVAGALNIVGTSMWLFSLSLGAAPHVSVMATLAALATGALPLASLMATAWLPMLLVPSWTLVTQLPVRLSRTGLFAVLWKSLSAVTAAASAEPAGEVPAPSGEHADSGPERGDPDGVAGEYPVEPVDYGWAEAPAAY